MMSRHDKSRVFGVKATVKNVAPNGWAVAEISVESVGENDLVARPGERIKLQPKLDVKQGDKISCVIVENNKNDRGGVQWFAIKCGPDVPRKSQVKWATWQELLSKDLLDTEPGSRHDGINLACWKCGQVLIKDEQIHRIKDTSVWTSTDKVSGELKIDGIGQYNKFKETEFFPVRCGKCYASFATLYKEPFLCDKETRAKTDENTQPTPCLKVTTTFKKQGDTKLNVRTVLVGRDEDAVRDAVESVMTTEMARLYRERLERGRVDRRHFKRQEMQKTQIKAGHDDMRLTLPCNVCFEDKRALSGVKCKDGHFTCESCFSRHVKSKTEQGDFMEHDEFRILCAEGCGCEIDRQLVDTLVTKEVHDKVIEARKKLDEKRIAAEVREQTIQEMEAERAREAQQTVTQNLIDKACRKILDDVLNVRCPNCKQTFDTFDGCFSVLCESCRHYFCACCLEFSSRSSVEAHKHVAQCERGKEVGMAGYYGRSEHWEEIKKKRRTRQLNQLLRSEEFADVAGQVIMRLQKDLEDLDLHAVVRRFEPGQD